MAVFSAVAAANTKKQDEAIKLLALACANIFFFSLFVFGNVGHVYEPLASLGSMYIRCPVIVSDPASSTLPVYQQQPYAAPTQANKHSLPAYSVPPVPHSPVSKNLPIE